MVYVIVLLNRKPQMVIPEGKTLVEQAYLDSLLAVPLPDTIVKDTTIYLTKVIYKSKIDTVHVDTTGVRSYVNAIKNDSIDVEVTDIIVGRLLAQDIAYKPIIRAKTVQVIKPYPQEVKVPVETPKTHFYVGGTFGGNFGIGLGGLSADIINKKGTAYGVSVLTDTKKMFIFGTVKVRIK